MLRPNLILTRLKARDRDDLLRLISVPLAEKCRTVLPEALFNEFQQREELGSTGIGGGVAIPHCKIKGLKETVLALATTEAPVNFDASDGEPVSLFLIVVSPSDGTGEHLQALASISRWLQNSDRVAELASLEDPAAIEGLFEKAPA